MRLWAVIGAVLWGAVSLFADGTSGDYLLSPDYSATGTKQFGTTSDLATYDRGGWYCEGDKAYARQNGVALRKEASGTLCYDFPEEAPETITTLTVSLCTAASGAVGKSHTLSYALEGTEVAGELTFTTSSQTEVVTVTLTFETPQVATGLRFSNPGTVLYELHRVEWAPELPELTIQVYTQSMVIVGNDFFFSLNAIEGGSGEYLYAAVTFNGETVPIDPSEVPCSVIFTAPNVSGDYTITTTVRDSEGNEKSVEQTCEVIASAAPENLVASDVTRTGFTVSWTLPSGVTPVSYTAIATPSPAPLVEKPIVIPEWTWNETASMWEITEPIDLSQWAGTKAMSSFVIKVFGVSDASLSVSFDGGSTWRQPMCLAGSYLVGSVSSEKRSLLLRADAATAPTYLSFVMTIKQPEYRQSITATAQKNQISFTELPANTTFEVKVVAYYEDGTHKQSEDLLVSTGAIPGFTQVQYYEKWKQLQLDWPADEPDLNGEIKLYATLSSTHETPDGLYLTRVLYTKSGDGYTTQKALVITNLSNRKVGLKGNYLLKSAKIGGTTTRSWDFSVTDEAGEKTYPYALAPGEELVITHESYPIAEQRDGLIFTTKAVMNFTPDWELSLVKDETVQNTLTPQLNSVVRLAEDSLETLEVTELAVEEPPLDVFYDPWTKIEAEHLIATIPLTQSALTSVSVSCRSYLQITTQTRKIRAVCRTLLGDAVSEPTEVILYQPIVSPGTMLIIR